ncbi:TAXI family TRAP transporter solute-binding subunit [Actinosynnema sp. NPDC047251]|uniref:TRAP transporter solute receptor, TAXI family n=1 Tax=Saccharothrix espanaensis (strain ATCC 51144 / DSM 44229 / JCM 9112 / NBRC 15066 / NRRL 15764) TaxID=1179773 RepID=K0JWI5_SACES|nr:TAXI family TRAP transporter solute-binding subunit [Saccharothrix espanaensis]CCH30416.1 TRAP transporter solute receptor, TAXI family [Saccharothrix espanaensis DSM 44229]
MNRRVFLLGVLGCVGGCATTGRAGELSVAAGERGGMYFDFATLLAGQLDPPSRVVETQGSLANLALLGSGAAQVALTLADATGAADPALDLRALGRVYENYLQLVVRADDPARRVADLAGRVVSLGAAGSGASLSGERMLGTAGLAASVRVEHLRLAEAVAALVERRIDALLWSGGVPTPILAQLPDIRLLPLADLLPGLRTAHGSVYEQVPVPAGVYGATHEVSTIGVANLLVCRASLPDDVAAAVTRTLVGKAAALVPEQALGTQFLDVRSLIGTADLPLHPGAAEAYRDLHG